MRLFSAALAACGLIAAIPALAQPTLDHPVGEYRSFRLDSGVLSNASDRSEVVYETRVELKGAAWLRLYFGDVVLEGFSYIRVTSLLDGDAQELDVDLLAMWDHTSAYFNGSAVDVELVAAPHTTRNRLVIERVAYEIGAADGDRYVCGICGSDDRTPSSEDWAGRILPTGCSASVWTTDSCLVSAGHCMSSNNVIQFQVPASNSNCSLNHPPAADQFPVQDYLYSNNGIGADWAVMTCGTNSYGQRPYDRYGELRPIAASPTYVGAAISIWGYGVDNECTRSQAQQLSPGTVQARSSTHYEHNAETPGGNSGSAITRSGQIVGIVTHCGCYVGGDVNYGTRADISAFVSAREQLCGGGAGGYCAASSDSDQYEYISNVTVGTINNTSGASPYSDYTGVSTELTRGEAHGFSVTIGSFYDSDIGGLWIDWNQDEDFEDANEAITDAWQGSNPFTTMINVPSGAALGATRLRVRIQDGDHDPNLSPCGTTQYGEVEDYTVVVVEGGGGEYCDASSNSTQYEHINNVTVGAIDHDSGATSYSDFTYLSTELARDEGHSFSLSIGTPYASDIGGLWIDWNQDEDFADTSETITTAWSGNGPYTTTITVPGWATLGATRLRARIQDSNYDPTLSPCDATSYGEVEDYTVVVTEGQPDPPANDDCADATAIGDGVHPFTNIAATMDGPEESGECQTLFNDVWFRYVASCSGDVLADTCDSEFDTVLAVYLACPSGPGQLIACNDDSCGTRSEVTFASTAGQAYYLRLGGYFGTQGTGTLTVSCQAQAPANDGCSYASAIGDGTHAYTNVNATMDGPEETGGCQALFNDVWFRYVAPCTGDVYAHTCDSDFDTLLAVYAGACPTAPGQFIACNDDSCENRSEVVFPSVAGQVYYVRIGGYFGVQGSGYLFMECQETAYPLGDMNCDGSVDFSDIDPFALALSDPAGYAAQFPDCDPLNGDCSEDGQLSFTDIDCFVDLLSS